MNIGVWVKDHKVATGILVVGGVIVFVLFSGWFTGGGSASVGTAGATDSGPSDSELAASASTTIAQIQASTQAGITASNNDLAAHQTDTGATVALAQIAAQLQSSIAQIGAAQHISDDQTAAALTAAGYQHDTDIATITASAGVQNNQIDTNASTILSILNALKPSVTPSASAAPTPAPGPSKTIGDYLQANPDIASEASRVTQDGEFASVTDYLDWHQATFGQENRGDVYTYQ